MTSLGALRRPGSRKDRQQGGQAPSLGTVWKVEAGYQSLLRRPIRRGSSCVPHSLLLAGQAERVQTFACCLWQLSAPTAGLWRSFGGGEWQWQGVTGCCRVQSHAILSPHRQ